MFRLTTAIPGGAGDNLSFLWNFWWMREALTSARSFFACPLLFVPNGVDLTLHTHTALPAFIGATLLRSLPPAAALNVTIIGSVFLAGLCTYLLAWRVTHDRISSILSGVVFAGSPYMAARLTGHFNLTHMWVLPLFAMVALEAARRRRIWWGVGAGAIAGFTAYIDYYYVVYQAVLIGVFVIFEMRVWRVSIRGGSEATRRLRRAVAIAIVLVAGLLIAIVASGGFELSLGPLRLSARTVYNPLQIFWAMGALWLWLRFRPGIDGGMNPGFDRSAALRLLGGTAIAFLVVASPLIIRGVDLLKSGEYVTHQYTWRSGPDGIDASTLVTGNPFHPVWGNWVRRLQESRGINIVESSAWPGVAVLFLAGAAVLRQRSDQVVRRWVLVGAVFFIWALGPHLMVFGANTGLPLPTAVLRYLPILSNVRMPGRAIVVVYLALAVLSAVGLAGWRRAALKGAPTADTALKGWTTGGTALKDWATGFILLCILVDFAAAPIRMTELPVSPLDIALRERPEQGALCELPLGIRDGFGERGHFDEWSLFRQTVHGRPLVGGFVARLSPSVLKPYDSDPLLSGLLRLSAIDAGATVALPDRRQALKLFERHRIAFVTLDRRTAGHELTLYVKQVLPLTLIAEDEQRSLYQVSR